VSDPAQDDCSGGLMQHTYAVIEEFQMRLLVVLMVVLMVVLTRNVGGHSLVYIG
jgi:hypothetical protein